MEKSKLVDGQRNWQAPKLQELGNLRHLVRVGGVNGKSGLKMDGFPTCAGETMGHDGEACSGV